MKKFEELGLIITRHGECLANVEKRIVGHKESPLTEKGLLQAHETGQKLKQKKIDAIVSSPLSRALVTTQIVAEYTKPREILVLPELKPQSFGVLEGHTREEAVKAGLSEFLHKPETDKYTHYVPGGETAQQSMERILPVYQLLEKLAKEKSLNMLLILHNSVIRAIAGGVWQTKPEDWVSLTVPNCEVFKIVQEQPFVFQSIFLKALADS